MGIESYTELKDYCFRRLGAPVIEIEIADEQAEDRINDALQTFAIRHYDGSTEVNYKKVITYDDQRAGYIKVPEMSSILDILTAKDATKSNLEVMDDLDYQFFLEYNESPLYGSGGMTDYYINMNYLANMRHLFTVDRMFTFNSMTNILTMDTGLNTFGSGNIVDSFNLETWTEINSTFTVLDNETPSGNLNGSTITDASGGTAKMGITFTYPTTWYVNGMYTFKLAFLKGTYTGKVDIRINDRAGNLVAKKTITPKSWWNIEVLEAIFEPGNINDLVITIETTDIPGAGETLGVWDPVLWKNNYIILQGYSTADPDEFDSIWDVEWIKNYATALMKRQWGANLKKYDGVQMPGGVTLNGQIIFDEAMTAIERLDEELELRYTLPIDFFIG